MERGQARPGTQCAALNASQRLTHDNAHPFSHPLPAPSSFAFVPVDAAAAAAPPPVFTSSFRPAVAHSPASDLSAAFTVACDIFDDAEERAASGAAAPPPLLGAVDEEEDDLLAALDGLDLPPLPSRGLAASYAPGAAFPSTTRPLSPASAAHAAESGVSAALLASASAASASVGGSLAESALAADTSAYGSFASSYTGSYASVPSLAAATHPLASGYGLSPAHASPMAAALRRVPSAPSVGWPAPGTSPSFVVGSAPSHRSRGGPLGPRGATGGLPRRGPLSATPPTLKPSPSAPSFASLRGRVSRPPRRPLDDDDDDGRGRKLHNPWTIEETEALVAGVEACGGGKWADIKKLNLPAIESRSAVDLKDKWRNLTRLVTLPSALPRALARADADGKRRLPPELLERVRALLPPADAPYGRLTPSRIPGARSRARQRR